MSEFWTSEWEAHCGHVVHVEMVNASSEGRARVAGLCRAQSSPVPPGHARSCPAQSSSSRSRPVQPCPVQPSPARSNQQARSQRPRRTGRAPAPLRGETGDAEAWEACTEATEKASRRILQVSAVSRTIMVSSSTWPIGLQKRPAGASRAS